MRPLNLLTMTELKSYDTAMRFKNGDQIKSNVFEKNNLLLLTSSIESLVMQFYSLWKPFFKFFTERSIVWSTLMTLVHIL